MPELPEAETIVRGLRPRIVGRTIEDVDVVHADVLRVPPDELGDCVTGRRIDEVERRGKNVVLRLSGEERVVVNLGMTGKLIPREADHDEPPPTHPAVVFHFENGGRLIFDDTRRFGAVECLDADGWRAFDERLGVEPLSRRFTARLLGDLLSRSRSPLRSWLLDQGRVAGVGNIYALEALWRAGLHPRLPARDVDEEGARRLHRALRTVLRRAVDAGGTTIRDYRDADGGTGEYVRRLAVYGREGEPCSRCRAEVERLVFGNRSAFLCPRCQPAP